MNGSIIIKVCMRLVSNYMIAHNDTINWMKSIFLKKCTSQAVLYEKFQKYIDLLLEVLVVPFFSEFRPTMQSCRVFRPALFKRSLMNSAFFVLQSRLRLTSKKGNWTFLSNLPQWIVYIKEILNATSLHALIVVELACF